MQTPLRKALGFGLIAAVSVLSVAPPAWSDDHRDGRGNHGRGHQGDQHREHQRGWERRNENWRRAADHREWERRRDFERHRAAAHWRFERNHGWRWEHRPGVWSPFFVWWVVDGRPLLRPYPTARVVRYPTGYYELVGDGIGVPFYWVWRPTVVVAAPPPVYTAPPPVPAAPPVPPGYEIPPAAYPPPPPVPTS